MAEAEVSVPERMAPEAKSLAPQESLTPEEGIAPGGEFGSREECGS